ncbi:MAG: hypothetical protein J6A15_00170 [Clostridia bacterium]|nr:hypothetical protein [Clostridia bacterium]
MKLEDYNKYYIQGSDHYLIPKDVFKELFNEMINWKEESQKQQEVIDKAIKKLNDFIECCKAEKLESGSDYLHHQYWDMFERFNKQVKDILKEVE